MAASPHAARRRRNGFSLVEILVVLLIVGIIAAFAIPAFNDSVRKSRRSEAVAAIVGVQQAQERWRGNNPAYTSSLTAAPTADPPGLGLAATTPGGYYTLSIPNGSVSATGYVVQAVAVAGTSQASDPQCKAMAARMAGGNITYAGCGNCGNFADGDFAATHVCWAQ
jgi:type IV pilus assembly protein PilE